MKGLRLLFLGGAFLIGCQVFGQAKLAVQISNLPAQFNQGTDTTIMNVPFDIINYGGSAFNGSVALNYTINGVFSDGYASNAFLQFPTAALSIPKGDTAHENMTVVVNQATFSTIGTSVVVIWPFSLSALTYDSITATVQIDSNLTSGLKPLADTKVSVFVNQQQLFIQAAGVNYLRHIKIFNLQGQLMVDQNLSTSTILSMDKYAAGCYLVELTFIDNSQKVYKVVNNSFK